MCTSSSDGRLGSTIGGGTSLAARGAEEGSETSFGFGSDLSDGALGCAGCSGDACCG